MGVNVVTYGGRTLVDMTDATVTEESLAEGATAYGANGEKVTGKMPTTNVLYTEQSLTEEDKSQARANINAASIDLLWKNASPTSEFAAQTLPFDRSGYDFFLLAGAFNNGTGNEHVSTVIIPNIVGYQGLLSGMSPDYYACCRLATVVSNGMSFGVGNMVSVTADVGYNGWNGRAVPREIYGVKL